MKNLFTTFQFLTLLLFSGVVAAQHVHPFLQEEANAPTFHVQPAQAAVRSNAPDWNWMQRIGGSGADAASGIAQDGSGNLYVAGTFSGVATFGNQTLSSVGVTDGYLAKYTSTGSLIWVQQIKAYNSASSVSAADVAVNANGDAWVLGQFTGNNITIGMDDHFSSDDPSGYLASFDPSGTPGWVRADLPTQLRQVSLGDDNKIYVLGDYALLQYTLAGSNIWIRFPDEQIFGAIHWHNNKLLLAGTFDTEANFDGNILQTDASGFFLVEVNPQGGQYVAPELLGTSTYPFGAGGQHINDFRYDASGNLLLVGDAIQSITFGSCTEANPGGFKNSFIAKLNNGNCQWLLSAQLPLTSTNNTKGLLMGDDGSIYVYGAKSGALVIAGLNIPNDRQGSYLLKINGTDGTGIWGVSQPPINDALLSSPDAITQVGTTGYHALLSRSGTADGLTAWAVAAAGDSGDGEVVGIEADDSGIYLNGNVGGNSMLLGEATALDGYGLFIAKTDFSGTAVWGQIVPGAYAQYLHEGRTMALDKTAGRLYCLATYQGVIDNLPGLPVLTNNSGVDHTLVFCLDVAGNYVWAADLGELYSTGITLDQSGNLFVGGTFDGILTLGSTTLTEAGAGDAALVKLDASGQISWAKRMGGSDNEFSLIPSADGQGNIYFTSESYSVDVDFDGVLVLNIPDNEGHVLLGKVGPNGNLLWLKSHGGTDEPGEEYSCFPTGLRTDAAGNCYMKGFLGHSNFFGNIHLTSPYSLNQFVAKFDPSGTPVWAKAIVMKRFGLNYGELDIDEAGNVYPSSQFRDSTYIGGVLYTPQGMARSAYYAKFSGDNGSVEWVKTLPSPFIHPLGMKVWDEQSLLLGGYFINSLNYDGNLIDSKGGDNGYLGLLGADIAVSTISAGGGESFIRIYPNPSSGPLHFQAAETIASMQVEIMDAQGNTLLNQQLDASGCSKGVDLGRYPAGVYFVKITREGGIEMKKVVIE